MLYKKVGNVWKVWFTDCKHNIQTTENKNLQRAICMAFVNKTTTLGEMK